MDDQIDEFDWWRTNDIALDSIPAISDAYLAIQNVAGNRPLPSKLPLIERGQGQVNLPPIVPGSQEESLINGLKSMNINIIDDQVQLLNWFASMEMQMCENVEDEKSNKMIQSLSIEKEYSECILRSVDCALMALNKVNEEYISVRQKTCALHNACETLLQEQTKLTDNAEAIHEKLSYFQELDSIRARLKSPNLEVNSEAFLALLAKLDSCIEYMSMNSQFKDAPQFLIRFNNCLTQALGQIKTHVMRSLESTTNGLLEKKPINKTYNQNSGNLSDDAFTLYYGRFRTNAPKIKALVSLIEQRSEKAEPYQQALTDIYTCYCAQREQLIGPGVYSSFSDLKDGRDVCGLVRASCAFMLHVCQDEHQLFRHFFNNSSIVLDDMLERLCQGLYDLVRPFIISIYHLETLAELCSILKLEMLDDHVLGNPRELGAFETIVKQMLEDVQERLVYRANIYIKTDILGFQPSSGDLAYPDKLQMMEDIAQSLNKEANANPEMVEVQLNSSSDHDDARKGSTSPADLHGMWYPTVRRVLVCLSKLYRCIERGIFQGLSQEALSSCVDSLIVASNNITNKKTQIDGQLFLVKHLLILREQIAPFHTDFSIRETKVDFGKTKTAANKLMNADNISRIFQVGNQNSILEFMLDGKPEIKEYFIDSKKHVDRQLKLACEDYINSQTRFLIGQMQDFVTRAGAIVQLAKKDPTNSKKLKDHKFASTDSLNELCSETYRELKSRTLNTQKSMKLYLANKDTEYILFKPIRLNIQAVMSQVQLILWENYTGDERAIVNAPTPEQVSLLLSLN